MTELQALRDNLRPAGRAWSNIDAAARTEWQQLKSTWNELAAFTDKTFGWSLGPVEGPLSAKIVRHYNLLKDGAQSDEDDLVDEDPDGEDAPVIVELE